MLICLLLTHRSHRETCIGQGWLVRDLDGRDKKVDSLWKSREEGFLKCSFDHQRNRSSYHFVSGFEKSKRLEECVVVVVVVYRMYCGLLWLREW